MILKPPRGHVFIMPQAEDPHFKGSPIYRHPDWIPISQVAKVLAVGLPEVKEKFMPSGKVKVVEEPCEVQAGDVIYYPGKALGHEIIVGSQTMRSLTFDQIKDCLVLEDDEAMEAIRT